MIEDNDRAIQVFVDLSEERQVRVLEEWYVVETDAGLSAQLRQATPAEFLRREVEKIQQGPEIEVVRDAAPEVPWILGIEGKPLSTIDELTKKTRSILTAALNSDGKERVQICGIWSTGEWLFHRDGWGNDLGDRLLSRGDVNLRILITRAGGVTGDRSRRRDAVRHRLLSTVSAQVQLRWLNWWELNRIVTVVRDKDGHREAIYMRRRLSSPLVCPYFIDRHAAQALKYVWELWEDYWDRGQPVTVDEACDLGAIEQPPAPGVQEDAGR